MSYNSCIETTISYFTSMNIGQLHVCLKEEYSFQDTTKEIFLSEIESIFEAHKNSGDAELIIYKGACGIKYAKTVGKKGFRFVGNHSKNYMDLLFETEGDDNIKDIYSSEQFKTDVEIAELGTIAYVYINQDDRVSFIKTR